MSAWRPTWTSAKDWRDLTLRILDPWQMELLVYNYPLNFLVSGAKILIDFHKKHYPIQGVDLVGKLARKWLLDNHYIQDLAGNTSKEMAPFDDEEQRQELLHHLAEQGLDTVRQTDWQNPFTPHILALHECLHPDPNVAPHALIEAFYGWYYYLKRDCILIHIPKSEHRDSFYHESLNQDGVWQKLQQRFSELTDPASWQIAGGEALVQKATRILRAMSQVNTTNIHYRVATWKFVFVAEHLISMSAEELSHLFTKK